MDKRVVKILVPTVASGALLLLWYKRMMIAMPAVWDPWFLAACAAGFIACGFTLDRMRIGSPALSLLDNRRIVVACSAAAGAGSLFTAAQGLAGLCGAVIGGFAAASAFLVVCAGGLRALPPNLRGSAFAAVFFLAGFVNTSTDLTELPLLLVSGLVPNVVMAAACAVLAALVAGVWGASFNTRVVAVAGAVSDDGAVAYADACASDGTGIGIGAYAKTAAASSVASAGDAFPAGDRIPADVEAKTAAGVGTGSSTGFEPKGARIQPMSRLMALAIGCFVLMYVAVSLKDSVAYPVAVESIVDNGFIRYVELPLWVIAGLVCDRFGRSELFASGTLCAFVGSAGLVAQPGTSAAALCTICSYFCLIGFPTACVCLAIDISYYVPRPAYVGAFCFAPIVAGAAAGACATSLTAEVSGETLFLASIACLSAFALLAAFLLRGLRAYRDVLAATPVIELPGDGPAPRDTAAIAACYGLTRRETEVLELIFKGLTVQQMADELVVSKSTVKFHITNILRKTGSENRRQMLENLDAQPVANT